MPTNEVRNVGRQWKAQIETGERVWLRLYAERENDDTVTLYLDTERAGGSVICGDLSLGELRRWRQFLSEVIDAFAPGVEKP